MDDPIDRMATQRVLEGCRKYGVIRLETDTRCFRREATVELLDAKNYLRWASEKGQIPQEDFLNLDKSIHLMVTMLMKSCPVLVALGRDGKGVDEK